MTPLLILLFIILIVTVMYFLAEAVDMEPFEMFFCQLLVVLGGIILAGV